MRTLACLSLLLAALAAGCGGADERSTAVEQLAALCEQARLDVEALGLPAEKGPEVIGTWANRGRRLARDVEKIDGATPEEQQELASISQRLNEYYSGLRLGYIVYKQTGSSESYALALDKARAFLDEAEALATQMGADECAKRPFADLEPSG